MYEHTYKIILVLLAIFSTGSCLAQNHSSNFELGFLTNYSTSIYKGVDSGVESLPFFLMTAIIFSSKERPLATMLQKK